MGNTSFYLIERGEGEQRAETARRGRHVALLYRSLPPPFSFSSERHYDEGLVSSRLEACAIPELRSYQYRCSTSTSTNTPPVE